MSDLSRLNVAFFNEKCDEERAKLMKEIPVNETLLNNLEAFRSIMPRIDEKIHESGYNVFDFMVEKQVFKLRLMDEIFSEFEYDLFNKVKVSESIPYVVINSASKEQIPNTSKFVSTKQKYKLYEDEDERSNIPLIVKDWTDDKSLLTPNTFIMKVLINKRMDVDSSKLKHYHYATFIYSPDDGFSISMKYSSRIQTELFTVIDHINENLPFKFEQDGTGTFSGKFGIDYFALDKSLFRMVLSKIPASPVGYFTFRNCMWVSESYRSVSHQSQSKVEFSLGSISQKLQITSEETTLNTKYEQNGIPYTFLPGLNHNYVTINDAQNPQDVLLIKSIFHCALYMYSQPFYPFTDPTTKQTFDVSYSMHHAYRLAVATGGATNLSFSNFTAAPHLSFKINIAYLKDKLKDSKLKVLKITDPTFYDRGVSSEISGVEHQPVVLVRTTDPNWENIVQDFVNSSDYDKYQLIRYPFLLESDDPANTIRFVMPPYFIRSDKIKDSNRSYIDLKQSKDPYGTKGTFHPYVISSSTRNHYVTKAGKNKQQALDDLIDLSRDFVLVDVQTSNSRDNDGRSTFTPLKAGTRAELFGRLKDFLVSNLGIKNNVSIKREGTNSGQFSLIEACVRFDLPKSNVIRDILKTRSMLIPETTFLENIVKPDITKDSWVSASQEFFDIPLMKAKENFLKGEAEITYEQYKTVLENYFGVSIMVITHYDRNFYFEKPRSKFFHAPRPYNSFKEGIIIVRHKFDNGYSRYEPLFFEGMKIPSSFVSRIFSRVNQFYKLGFNTSYNSKNDTLSVNSWSDKKYNVPSLITYLNPISKIERQILDGAGKLRAVIINGLILWVESLHPLIGVEVFEMGDGSFNFNPSVEYAEAMKILRGIVPMEVLNNNIRYKTKGGYPTLVSNEVKGLDNKNRYTVEGLWITLDDLRLYVFLFPVEMEIERTSIDDSCYFEISEEDVEFKRFDYLERLANIVVQLLHTMYVYWPYDDPKYFIERYTYVNSALKSKSYVNINSISRRIPKPRKYTDDKFYTNGKKGRVDFEEFLKQLRETYGEDLFTEDGRIIIDSEKSKDALFNQCNMIQRLKESYFLESGHKINFNYEGENRMRIVTWSWNNPQGEQDFSSTKLEQSFIDNVPKLSVLMEIRSYFKEFYVYSSDFETQSTGQKIFMDRADLEDYYEYENYKSEFVLHKEISRIEVYTGKTPIYYQNRAGHIFALQRVEADDRNRALIVADTWTNSKVNLGFYARNETKRQINIRGVSSNGSYKGTKSLDEIGTEDDSYVYIYNQSGGFGSKNKYAALLKINSSTEFSISRELSCEI